MEAVQIAIHTAGAILEVTDNDTFNGNQDVNPTDLQTIALHFMDLDFQWLLDHRHHNYFLHQAYWFQ